MRCPTLADARELLAWRPPLGVVSVYLEIDPADRRGGWRTALRNALDDLVEATDDREHRARVTLRDCAGRVPERFAEADHDNLGRGQVGFVEVAGRNGEERWWRTQLPLPGPTCAYLSSAPVLAPLVDLAGRSAPRGAVVLSAERIRLFERTPGHLEELHDWELTLFSGEWRERKAPTVAPLHTRGVSASGRDQNAERLDHNRQRFLTECGQLVRAAGSERDWPEVVAFGTPPEVDRFVDGIPAADSPSLVAGPAVDLVSEPSTVVLEQVERAFADLAADRDRRLVERTVGEIRPGGRATGGVEETEAALVMARVEHLVVAGGLAPLDPPCEDHWPRGSDDSGDDSESAGSEPLVRRALCSGAEVSVVDAGAAELLKPFDGVAALLRY
jgi:hypothetical protein